MTDHEVEALNQVAEFHQLFEHPIMNHPSIPSARRCALRYNLLDEELQEFIQAIRSGDLVGIADALADLQYVLSGAVLEFGLQNHFAALFNEIHRSNMSKACPSEEVAQRTIEYAKGLPESHGHTFHIIERGGLFFVYRDDKKTIKSINYSPATLNPILLS